MKHAQSMLNNKGFETEELFDQLTYDLAKSYETEMKKEMSSGGQGDDKGKPAPHDSNHNA